MTLLRTFLALLLAFQTPIMGTGARRIFIPHGTAGPNNAGTASGWTNSSNATACNGLFATNIVGQGSQSLNFTVSNFGFAVPGNVTIKGVSASVTHKDITGNGGIYDVTVRLEKAGVATGNNLASGTGWAAGSSETFTYGGISNLWGATWTSSDINNSGFGLLFTAKNTDLIDGNATIGIDCITLTVTY